MSWTLTVGGVAVQNYVRPFSSLKVKHRGYRGLGTLSARLVEKEATPGSGTYSINPQNEDSVVLVDTGVTIFGGYVRRRIRKDLNTSGIRVVELECQDYNSDPSDDPVPLGTGPRTTAETDQARVRWLFATFGTRGVDATTAACQVVFGSNLPTQDFDGMSLAQAMDEICKISGAQWYVDYNHKLHYFKTESTAAPWNIDIQSPNNTTTFPAKDFEYPDDTIDYVNTVIVIGAGVTATRYRGGSAPAAGTQRLYILRDTALRTVQQCNDAGDAYLSANTNRQAGKVTVWKSGLFPGQLIHIKNTMWSIDADFRIAEVVPKYIDLDKALYDVSFGSNPVDLSDLWGKQAGDLTAVQVTTTELGGGNAGTLIPPATPTGLAVATGTRLTPDGNGIPYLSASWTANSEGDIDAYEIEIDRALEGDTVFSVSVSGTGGTLGAGSYSVKVTGQGQVAGETYQSADKDITLSAGQKLFVNITARSGVTTFKIYATRTTGEPLSNGQTTAVTGSNVEITPEGAGAASPAYSTAVAFLNPKPYRTAGTTAYTEDVQGGWYYAARIRAVNRAGLKSPWTTPQGIKISGDTSAPAIPSGLTAVAGYKLVGVKWAASVETDLQQYELRWAPDCGNGNGPNTLQWVKVDTLTTHAVVDGLVAGTKYYFQVRAIDRSGNVVTSSTDSTAVDADDNPEAGWSNTVYAVASGLSTTLAAAAVATATNVKVVSVTGANVGDLMVISGGGVTTDEIVTIGTVGTAGAGGTGITFSPALVADKANGNAVTEVTKSHVTGTPNLIGAADVSFNSVLTSILSTNQLDATTIKTGTLSIGGGPSMPTYLLVFNGSGVEIGRWDSSGLLIKDPTNTNQQVRLMNGILEFSSDGGASWQTAISSGGIRADSILLGTAPGGHNNIPNASFELSAFGATFSKVWTINTDWATAIGVSINADTSTGDLKLLAVAY
jgi:hypothetical protein